MKRFKSQVIILKINFLAVRGFGFHTRDEQIIPNNKGMVVQFRQDAFVFSRRNVCATLKQKHEKRYIKIKIILKRTEETIKKEKVVGIFKTKKDY